MFMKEDENCWSCWIACIGEDISLVVSHTYAGKGIGRMLKSCNGGSYENKCKKSNFNI